MTHEIFDPATVFFFALKWTIRCFVTHSSYDFGTMKLKVY